MVYILVLLVDSVKKRLFADYGDREVKNVYHNRFSGL